MTSLDFDSTIAFSSPSVSSLPVCEQLPRTLRARTATYILTHLLTRTSHATLYHAYDSRSPSTPLVLKRLERSRHARREAEVHRAIGQDTPNTVPLLDTVTTHDHIYLVMPYYRNGDLFDLIMTVHSSLRQNDDDNADLIEEWAVEVFYQLLQGTAAMHARGIWHRDLKPENVFIDDEGCVRVADFGLATMDASDGARGYGSEFYMDPAAASDDADDQLPVPEKSDVWALGILLLNLLSGRNPWPRADARHDAAFADYLRSPAALHSAFGLAPDAAYLVSRMLCPCVDTRASLEEVMTLAAHVRRWTLRAEDDHVWEHVAAEATVPVSSGSEFDYEEEQDDHDHATIISELASLRLSINAGTATACAASSIDEDDTVTTSSVFSDDEYGKPLVEPTTPSSGAFPYRFIDDDDCSTNHGAIYSGASAVLLDDDSAAAWMLEHGGSGATALPNLASSSKRLHSRRASLAYLFDNVHDNLLHTDHRNSSLIRPASALPPTTPSTGINSLKSHFHAPPSELDWSVDFAAALAF